MLQSLQEAYRAPPDYGYDADAVERRGIERASQLLRLSGASSAQSFLEIGCWDGMVSAALQRRGKTATAIDNRSDGFDDRARAAGVHLAQMDAARLSFGDASFDFVFSYDAFEHVASPEDVLREV
ncbi:MAG: class I SAM-dependent methyltransferase, partial [Pseudomonadales bacterium]|nr:class I SAM-dependent methyltransferase [Pseudomonadales bacterium]